MDNNLTIYENFLEVCEKFNNKNAVYYEGKDISFKELKNKVNRFASYYESLGLKKEDTVLIIGPNTPEVIASFLACSQKGIIAYLLSPLAKEDTIINEYKDKKCKLVIIVSALMNNYENLLKEDFNFLTIDPSESLSFIKRKAYGLLNKETLKVYKKYSSLPSYHDIKTIDEKYVSYDNKKGSVLLSSGGTSGKAKTIILSDFAITSLIKVAPSVLGDSIRKDITKKYMLASLPMFHGFGLVMGVLTLLLHGGAISVIPKFRTQKVTDLVKKNKCHILIGVPTMFEALLKNDNFNGDILKNIDIAFIGGDFIAPSLLERFNKRLKDSGSKAMLFEGYGLTETVTVLSVNTFENNYQGSIGKCLSNVKVKILDDDHREVKANVKGEIAVAGETLMNGYIEGESPFIEIDNEKYVLTGDIGYKNEVDFIFFLSRKKRIIKRKGFNIFPLEIEKYISSLEGIINCSYLSTIGEKQEDTYLFLEISKDKSEEEIKEVVKNEIIKKGQDYEVPDHIIFVKDFPKTPVGKVDYQKLLKLI